MHSDSILNIKMNNFNYDVRSLKCVELIDCNNSRLGTKD
jgi:hypothetical protein